MIDVTLYFGAWSLFRRVKSKTDWIVCKIDRGIDWNINTQKRCVGMKQDSSTLRGGRPGFPNCRVSALLPAAAHSSGCTGKYSALSAWMPNPYFSSPMLVSTKQQKPHLANCSRWGMKLVLVCCGLFGCTLSSLTKSCSESMWMFFMV